uniref:IstB-like ATP binding protein n=1 Tax=Candidatus Kentrum sp. TUN TaxID=2126343 RepID=A0A451A5N1_9GAMM|nr:MAG: IstB-like ATP binding protein [Candidatus Kentron sp. TUN]VFK70248.1 MAG: IstB-like ATP binding protein [Candidatus Kentron sp. TUN]
METVAIRVSWRSWRRLGHSKNQPQRADLMEVIEDRHGLRSTLVASQLPVDLWHDYIGEVTLADAILDRLIHNAHRLPLQGESMRRQVDRSLYNLSKSG